MSSKNKTLVVTGHRPKYFKDGEILLWASEEIHAAIQRAISAGFTKFISGGALGIDQIFADWVLYEKRKLPSLHLAIARPFPTQDAKWSMPDRIKYLGLLRDADEVIDVSDGLYDPRKMFERNRWMVDRADAAIGVLSSKVRSGGTFQAVRYAQRKAVPVYLIDPATQEAKWG